MPFEAQLAYSRPLLQHAILAYWKRSIGIILPFATLALFADLVFMLARGDRSW